MKIMINTYLIPKLSNCSCIKSSGLSNLKSLINYGPNKGNTIVGYLLNELYHPG